MKHPFLSRDELLDRIPIAHAKVPAIVDLHEADYALTRLVRENCLVLSETPTPLVIKGGFAVRHIHGGMRFSKDADVILASPDLEIDGAEPGLLRMPPGMEVTSEALTEAGKSWVISIHYVGTDRRGHSVTCDLNSRVRALRLQPPRHEIFSSLFFDGEWRVWTASAEEIVAEKLAALLEEGADRIRDIFDVCTVLSTGPKRWDGTASRALLDKILIAKQIAPPDDLIGAVHQVSAAVGAEAAWQSQVIDVMPTRPRGLLPTVEELDDLLVDWGLAQSR
jgi:predicted nucleotidyltransferase component of viral defense system